MKKGKNSLQPTVLSVLLVFIHLRISSSYLFFHIYSIFSSTVFNLSFLLCSLICLTSLFPLENTFQRPPPFAPNHSTPTRPVKCHCTFGGESIVICMPPMMGSLRRAVARFGERLFLGTWLRVLVCFLLLSFQKWSLALFCSFVRSCFVLFCFVRLCWCVCLFGCSFAYWLVCSMWTRLFVCSFFCSFVCLFVCLFACSFVRLFACSFFVYSFVRFFACSLVRLFVYSFLLSCLFVWSLNGFVLKCLLFLVSFVSRSRSHWYNYLECGGT